MSSVTVNKSRIFGRVKAVPSKSYAHRILLCAAFSDAPVKVNGLIPCDDVNATLGCINALGAKLSFGDQTTVTPVKHAKTAVLNCIESGSTLRFLIPICAALGGEYTFTGEGRLPQRPNAPLINALKTRGIQTEGEGLPLTLKGKLSGGDFLLPGNVSSQYITGLILAAPLIGDDVNIIIEGELKSVDYINITLDVMSQFGVKVSKTDVGYFIKGGQKYSSPKEISVEGDWSNAAFMLAAGLLCGRVEVEGLNPDSVQGDRKILEVLKLLGGDVKYEKAAYIAQRSTLFGNDFCVENIIDAAPVLSVLCAFANGKSVMSGVDRLKIKESDRLQAIIDMVSSLGGSAEYAQNKLTITPVHMHEGATLNGFGDHRMVMSGVVAGGAAGNVTVTGAEAVNKSYPDFFKDYAMLGGDFFAGKN